MRTLGDHHKHLQRLTVAEEQALADRLMLMDDWNVPATKKEAINLANRIYLANFPDEKPLGNEWFRAFLARRKEFKFIYTQNKEKLRVNAEDWDLWDDYFAKLEKAIKKRKIKPKNIWDMDEKGFRLSCGKRMRRVVARFQKREAGSKEARQRESLTVIECINTEGKYVEPTVIYEGTAGPLCGWFREEREHDFWYGNSKSGFNNTAIMIEWIQIVFEPETRPKDPNEWRLLIFDGFDAHLDPDVVDFALDHNIICFSLPSHCTHEGQPLDKAVFGPLENAYSKLVAKEHTVVTKERFQELYALARREACTKKNAIAGFEATGIHPFNPSKVLEKCRIKEPKLPDRPLTPPPNIKNMSSQQLFELPFTATAPPRSPRSLKKATQCHGCARTCLERTRSRGTSENW
jgi:hypothetical protein